MRNSSRIAVGEQTITYNYASMSNSAKRGMASETQMNGATFYWPYAEALKKAALLYHLYLVGLTKEPPNYVLMSFDYELILVTFIKKPDNLISTNLDE
ncbi:hypothetical protein RND81_10G234500 [Saponaria officinalis]